MKKIIVTTAICTAFFSTLACAEPPAVPQPPQTADQKADEALGKVNDLTKSIDNIGKQASDAQNRAIENGKTIEEHTNKLTGIEDNKKEIARINDDVVKKLETYRTVGQLNKNAVEKAVEKVNTAVQDIEQVKEKANKVTDLETQIGAIQDNANVLKGRVDGHDEKIKNLEEKAGALPDVIAQAQDAQVQATAAKSKAEKAEKEVEKVDKELLSLRDDIKGAMGAPKGEINALRNQTNKGLAKVTALAGLHPLAFDKNNKLSLSVASGSYNSEHALALGGFYQPNRDVLLSFGSSVSGNGNAYTFGASVRVGSHSKTAEKQHVSQVAELYAAIAKLQAQVEKQQKEIVQLQRAK